MNQLTAALIASAVPTLAIIAAFVRNEAALRALSERINSLEHALTERINSLEQRFDHRIETLDRDLREWAKITMQHNSDIARLKDKAGLQ